jgi:hypothetical protein
MIFIREHAVREGRPSGYPNALSVSTNRGADDGLNSVIGHLAF